MRYPSQQSGFTLIEMLVSLTLFTMVITITVGSLLVLINGNRQLTNSQSVLDTLAFSLDSMTREIRTGQYYFCGGVNQKNNGINVPGVPGPPKRIFKETSAPPGGNTDHDNLGAVSLDCSDGKATNDKFHGVSVIESGDSITGTGASRILYYYQTEYTHPSAPAGSPPIGTIMRRVGNERAQPIISSHINVTDADFIVTGAERLSDGGNTEQPTVTIWITAEDISDPTSSTTIQTTITQRELDI